MPWYICPVEPFSLGAGVELVSVIGYHYHNYGAVYSRSDFADVVKVPSQLTFSSSQGRLS